MPDDGQPRPDEVFSDLDDALSAGPGIVVVANPTSLHVPTALAAVRSGCNVLIEKPLSDDLDGCDELADEARARGVVVSVACNLRFHPCLRLVRDWVASGEPLGAPLTARAHFGTYLPDWHPWEDYLASYAARRELGGGAALTHVHEIDYVLWLFGPAERVCGQSLGKRPLGTDVDEASSLVVRHAGGTLSTITVSLAERPPSRRLDLAFTQGTASIDLLAGRWEWRHADGRVSEGSAPNSFDIDHTYRDQAAAFLAAVRTGEPPEVTLDEGKAALEAALTVED
jgi:predicted dehydrogenase